MDFSESRPTLLSTKNPLRWRGSALRSGRVNKKNKAMFQTGLLHIVGTWPFHGYDWGFTITGQMKTKKA